VALFPRGTATHHIRAWFRVQGRVLAKSSATCGGASRRYPGGLTVVLVLGSSASPVSVEVCRSVATVLPPGSWQSQVRPSRVRGWLNCRASW
jgi:hypothetical protein